MDVCHIVASLPNIPQVAMVTQISSPYLSLHLHRCLHVFAWCLLYLSGTLYLCLSHEEHLSERKINKDMAHIIY